MKFKCKHCQELFKKSSEFNSHNCVKSLEKMSLEELLRLYNKPNNA